MSYNFLLGVYAAVLVVPVFWVSDFGAFFLAVGGDLAWLVGCVAAASIPVKAWGFVVAVLVFPSLFVGWQVVLFAGALAVLFYILIVNGALKPRAALILVGVGMAMILDLGINGFGREHFAHSGAWQTAIGRVNFDTYGFGIGRGQLPELYNEPLSRLVETGPIGFFFLSALIAFPFLRSPVNRGTALLMSAILGMLFLGSYWPILGSPSIGIGVWVLLGLLRSQGRKRGCPGAIIGGICGHEV